MGKQNDEVEEVIAKEMRETAKDLKDTLEEIRKSGGDK